MSSAPQFGKHIASGSTSNYPTGPSPSFNPLMIESIDGYDDTTKGYVAAARDAFAVGQAGLESLWEAAREVGKNSAWSGDRKIVEVASASRRVQERVIKAFANATDTLRSGVNHIEGELQKPIDTGAVNTQLAGEIRTMLRKEMSDKERTEFITAAIESNDTRTIHAVLGGTPALSGLHPTLHANYVRQYREKTAPDMVKRLGVMQSALDRLDRTGPNTFAEVEKVLHLLEDNNTGPATGVWKRVEHIEAKYKAARVALDSIP